MPRVEVADVRLIIDTQLGSSQINALIQDASRWVDRFLAGCSKIEEEDRAIIEKYLTAGFISRQEAPLRSAQRGDVRETYAGDAEGNEFFKLAAAHDPCRIVAEYFLGARRVKARFGRGYQHGKGHVR